MDRFKKKRLWRACQRKGCKKALVWHRGRRQWGFECLFSDIQSPQLQLWSKQQSGPSNSRALFKTWICCFEMDHCSNGLQAPSCQLPLLSKVSSQPLRGMEKEQQWRCSCLAPHPGDAHPADQVTRLTCCPLTRAYGCSDTTKISSRLVFNNKCFQKPEHYTGPRKIREETIISCCNKPTASIPTVKLIIINLYSLHTYIVSNIWVRGTF